MTTRSSGTVVECDRALYEIVAKKPVAMKAELKGLQYNTRTWEHRAAGAFLFLHPGIYGQGSFSERTEKVGVEEEVTETAEAAAMEVQEDTGGGEWC